MEKEKKQLIKLHKKLTEIIKTKEFKKSIGNCSTYQTWIKQAREVGNEYLLLLGLEYQITKGEHSERIEKYNNEFKKSIKRKS